MAVQLDPIEIGGLILLGATFLLVPQITIMLKSSLDTLPMRLAAVLIILGSISYNKYLALGVFLVIMAVFVDHHHGDVLSVIGSANMSAFDASSNAAAKFSNAMDNLHQGGSSDETYDSSDFTSKTEDQDNEFKGSDNSMDEKQTLLTEPLGSKAASLFPNDSKHVDAMEHGNRNGYSD